VRAALSSLGGPADLPTVAAAFDGKRTPKRLAEVEEILEMLVALGQVEGETAVMRPWPEPVRRLSRQRHRLKIGGCHEKRAKAR
jgi:hypothetical protein